MRFLTGTKVLSLQSLSSFFAFSLHEDCCLEVVTLIQILRKPMISVVSFTKTIRVGKDSSEHSLFTARQEKTGRHKCGLTFSWSTIAWLQIQSDCPQLSDDPYSMQNSLSCWFVPTSLVAAFAEPLGHGFEWNQNWTQLSCTQFLLTTITLF